MTQREPAATNREQGPTETLLKTCAVSTSPCRTRQRKERKTTRGTRKNEAHPVPGSSPSQTVRRRC